MISLYSQKQSLYNLLIFLRYFNFILIYYFLLFIFSLMFAGFELHQSSKDLQTLQKLDQVLKDLSQSFDTKESFQNSIMIMKQAKTTLYEINSKFKQRIIKRLEMRKNHMGRIGQKVEQNNQKIEDLKLQIQGLKNVNILQKYELSTVKQAFERVYLQLQGAYYECLQLQKRSNNTFQFKFLKDSNFEIFCQDDKQLFKGPSQIIHHSDKESSHHESQFMNPPKEREQDRLKRLTIQNQQQKRQNQRQQKRMNFFFNLGNQLNPKSETISMQSSQINKQFSKIKMFWQWLMPQQMIRRSLLKISNHIFEDLHNPQAFYKISQENGKIISKLKNIPRYKRSQSIPSTKVQDGKI